MAERTIPQSLRDSSLCSREPYSLCKFKVFRQTYRLLSTNFLKNLHLPKAPLSKGSCHAVTEGLSPFQRFLLFENWQLTSGQKRGIIIIGNFMEYNEVILWQVRCGRLARRGFIMFCCAGTHYFKRMRTSGNLRDYF